MSTAKTLAESLREWRSEGTPLAMVDEAADELERQSNNAAILAQQVADMRAALERLWDEYKQAHPSYRSDYEQGYLDALDAAIDAAKKPAS